METTQVLASYKEIQPVMFLSPSPGLLSAKGIQAFVCTCFRECDSSKRVKMQKEKTKQRLQKKENKKKLKNLQNSFPLFATNVRAFGHKLCNNTKWLSMVKCMNQKIEEILH